MTEYGHYQTDHWITEREACAWLKCTRHSLYRYRRDGILKNYIRMGKGPRAVIRYSWREIRDALMPDDKELWRLHNERRGTKAARPAKNRRAKQPQPSTGVPTPTPSATGSGETE